MLSTVTVAPEALFGPRMTIEEWAALPDEVPGEYVEGRLVEEEVPDFIHEVLLMWLGQQLANWGDARGAIVGGSVGKYGVSDSRGRKPDLSVFFRGRRPPARGLCPSRRMRQPPDVAVEVISSSKRDQRREREEKMAEYAAFGVRFYWLLDPQRRTFEIFALAGDDYERTVHACGGIVQATGCEGLELDLDAMWAKADELED